MTVKNTRTHKPDPTSVLKTLAEADHALERLGYLDRSIAEIEGRTAEQVKDLQRRQAETTEPLIAERKTLARELEVFARDHDERGGFGDKRALELPSGFIGFRKSTRVKWIPRKVDDVIAMIRSVSRATRLGKALADAEAQIIKVKETPVKGAIRALDLSEDDYARIGVRIERVDAFAYSTDKSREFDLSDVDEDVA